MKSAAKITKARLPATRTIGGETYRVLGPGRLQRTRRLTPKEVAHYETLRREALCDAMTLRPRGATGRLGTVAAVARLMNQLKRERIHQGLSLSVLAARTGIDKAALSRLENGRHLNPTFDTLCRYASALNKSIVLKPT